MKKVINLFTHTDLDGVACSVLIHLHYRDRNAITVKYCDYSDVDQRLNDFMDNVQYAEELHSMPEVDREIYITDISISPDTAARLDSFATQRSIKLFLLDHHTTAIPLRQFPWVKIDDRPFVCAASMLYQHLREDNNSMLPCSAVYFIEDVRQYDTWEFNKDIETNADNLNILLKLLGKDRFELTVTNHFILHPGRFFLVDSLEDVYAAVEGEIAKRKEYMSLRNQRVRKAMYRGYVVGIVFAEQHISRTGDYVLKKNPDIDICAIVNFPKSVSLRTLRDDINLGSDIAEPLGGGGHRKAAAFQLKTPPIDLILEMVGLKEDPNDPNEDL